MNRLPSGLRQHNRFFSTQTRTKHFRKLIQTTKLITPANQALSKILPHEKFTYLKTALGSGEFHKALTLIDETKIKLTEFQNRKPNHGIYGDDVSHSIKDFEDDLKTAPEELGIYEEAILEELNTRFEEELEEVRRLSTARLMDISNATGGYDHLNDKGPLYPLALAAHVESSNRYSDERPENRIGTICALGFTPVAAAEMIKAAKNRGLGTIYISRPCDGNILPAKEADHFFSVNDLDCIETVLAPLEKLQRWLPINYPKLGVFASYGPHGEKVEAIKACNEKNMVFMGANKDWMEHCSNTIEAREVAIECGVNVIQAITIEAGPKCAENICQDPPVSG